MVNGGAGREGVWKEINRMLSTPLRFASGILRHCVSFSTHPSIQQPHHTAGLFVHGTECRSGCWISAARAVPIAAPASRATKYDSKSQTKDTTGLEMQ